MPGLQFLDGNTVAVTLNSIGVASIAPGADNVLHNTSGNIYANSIVDSQPGGQFPGRDMAFISFFSFGFVSVMWAGAAWQKPEAGMQIIPVLNCSKKKIFKPADRAGAHPGHNYTTMCRVPYT